MNHDSTTLENARSIQDQLVAWRRDFHMHPEVGFHEARTAARVAEILIGLGYRVRAGVARTGVIAELGEDVSESSPSKDAPTVAIRADMDALPILEANEVSYASRNAGIMHACGHDAHTTIALGVATLLAGQTFPGRVRFLFQPAEEVNDEQGVSGAPRMIEAGAMEGVDAVFGLHVDPSLPTGSISADAGAVSAGVDTLYAAVIGKGGHGAAPHKVVDPIYLSSYVVLALHGIVSRRLHPFDPAVLSIGSIHGGNADNVIPDRVELTGTIRYMQPEVQQQIHAEIERAMEITRALGGDYELRIKVDYPPMFNHPQAVELIRATAADLLGVEHILPRRSEMGAEDFGFLSKLAPGAMFRLGCRIEGDERKVHSPRFDIDEGCLLFGVAMLAETALRYLRHGSF